MKRTFAMLLAMTTVHGTVLTGIASAADERQPSRADELRSSRETLQRDADALLGQGGPGVLAELDTPQGAVKVRGGTGNIGMASAAS